MHPVMVNKEVLNYSNSICYLLFIRKINLHSSILKKGFKYEINNGWQIGQIGWNSANWKKKNSNAEQNAGI